MDVVYMRDAPSRVAIALLALLCLLAGGLAVGNALTKPPTFDVYWFDGSADVPASPPNQHCTSTQVYDGVAQWDCESVRSTALGLPGMVQCVQASEGASAPYIRCSDKRSAEGLARRALKVAT